MLKVVLDTNIVLSCVSRRSPFHFILEELFRGNCELFVTTEILLEYEEKLASNFSQDVAEVTLTALLLKKNVKKIQVHFDLELIKDDLDDNKFVNCAFAANVHYIVSNDRHFNILKTTDFPRINLLKIDQFFELLHNQ